MSCYDRINDGTVTEAKLPEPTMADIMRETSALVEQNHMLARRIRAFLTGVSEDQNESSNVTSCFREELLKARYDAFRTNEELGSLAVELGLP